MYTTHAELMYILESLIQRDVFMQSDKGEYFGMIRFGENVYDVFTETEEDGNRRAKEAVQHAKKILRDAEEFYTQGYRLHKGLRKQFGLTHNAPADALVSVLLPSGFIGTTEAYTLYYLTRS